MALLLFVPAIIVWLMLLGVSIADVIAAARRSTSAVYPPARAWAKLLSLSLVPWAAWVAGTLTSGWSDVDGNGMLDGMAAGAYDAFDIVLPSALVWGVVLAVAIHVALTGPVSRAMRRLVRRAEQAEQ